MDPTEGTPAGDLSMEPPSKFELTVNLKVARAMGLMVPPALVAQASQLIE